MRFFVFVILTYAGSVSGVLAEPKPYSVERYKLIWQGAHLYGKASPAQESFSQREEWEVAGVFSFGKDEGAVVVNRNTGAIEYLNTTSPSPSGLMLSRISSRHSGQAPAIEVVQNGRSVTLTGSTVGILVPHQVALQYRPTELAPISPAVTLAETH